MKVGATEGVTSFGRAGFAGSSAADAAVVPAVVVVVVGGGGADDDDDDFGWDLSIFEKLCFKLKQQPTYS